MTAPLLLGIGCFALAALILLALARNTAGELRAEHDRREADNASLKRIRDKLNATLDAEG